MRDLEGRDIERQRRPFAGVGTARDGELDPRVQGIALGDDDVDLRLAGVVHEPSRASKSESTGATPSKMGSAMVSGGVSTNTSPARPPTVTR